MFVESKWHGLITRLSDFKTSSYARWLAGIAIYLCFVNIKELPSWI